MEPSADRIAKNLKFDFKFIMMLRVSHDHSVTEQHGTTLSFSSFRVFF